mmetsp:Transcript_19487/g.41871  ORF Transcript_19487/g.41871 Transcript_19487/m.41871 type:complete len:83 (+) Transcript_19487:1882-2130(+)
MTCVEDCTSPRRPASLMVDSNDTAKSQLPPAAAAIRAASNDLLSREEEDEDEDEDEGVLISSKSFNANRHCRPLVRAPMQAL